MTSNGQTSTTTVTVVGDGDGDGGNIRQLYIFMCVCGHLCLPYTSHEIACFILVEQIGFDGTLKWIKSMK